MKKYTLIKSDLALLARYGLGSIDMTNAVRFCFDKGEYLSRENEPLHYIYFVVSGKAKALLNLSDGKQLLLAYFISNGIIGDVELMTDVQANLATLQAVTPFVCVALPLSVYRDVLKHNIVFINYVGSELAKKLMQRAVNGAITTLQPLETRLCAYILQTANDGVFCETLTEVAAMVGGSYRHLLRCLDKLCADGVLEKKGRGYLVIDLQVLEARTGDLYVLK